MPLLRKQPFVKKKHPPNLHPDEEVFCCETTNEIFRDYEEFFNRVIECNSLVWTCGITGRPGLTYQEALESEERARKHLESFPTYLRRVVLYLASRTKRSRLSDMNDDVFVYVKDRYFKGEVVDAVVDQEKFLGVKVVKVVPPKTVVPEVIVLDGDSDDEPLIKAPSAHEDIDPTTIQYVVQIPDGKEYTVPAESVGRKKGIFTRDKNKLLLKQYCEAVDGVWKVKAKIALKYKLEEVVYAHYFSTRPPVFPNTATIKKKAPPKKANAEAEALKKAKKEKNDKLKKEKEGKKKILEEAPKKLTQEERLALKEKLKQEKEARKQALLEEKMAKREEVMQKHKEEREKRKLELQEERKKRMEEKQLREKLLKEWNKQRDDMECDDLKPLPQTTPVQTCLPPELFGDAVMLLEFTKHFNSILDMEDHFPDGFDYRTLEQALIDPDTNGPLTDLCEAFLSTIISLQEEEEAEEDELNQGDEDTSVTVDDSYSSKTVTQLIQDATLASQWSLVHHGMPLKKLTFDAMTLSEILRLHFLSSGARASARSVKFRYQQRGGYTSLDDAGLEFKISEPELFKTLCTTSVFDMTPAQKLKIITALSHQILTYAASRDMIDDTWEKLKQAKMDVKHHQWAENQREKEEASARYKKRMEERAKERAREEERRAQRKKELEEKLKNEGSIEDKTSGDVEMKDQSSDKADVKKSKKDEESSPEPNVRTRHKAAAQDELRAQIEEGSFDVDESKLLPEDLLLLKQRRKEIEAKKKEEYYEEERELISEVVKVQNGFNITPLGQDRAYRRFWLFDSIPGLFVEVDDVYLDESMFQPMEQIDNPANPLKNDGMERNGDDKSTASDKENESFDGNSSKVLGANKSDNPLSTATVNVEQHGGVEAEEKMEVHTEKVELASVNIVPDRSVTWSYYSTADQLDQLISGLNPRGFREAALKQSLTDQKQIIESSLNSTSLEFLKAGVGNVEDAGKNETRIKSVKSRNREVKGKVKNASAQEFMELNLREMLLDMEERIYAGSLGAIQAKDRGLWREAIESGSYSPQCHQLTWSGQKEDVRNISADDGKSESEEEEISQLVKDLARALLQIQQGIEPRFLNQPLGEGEAGKKSKKEDAKKSKKNKDDGDDDKHEEKDGEKDTRPTKTVLERWEESLMKSTSLSQIFLHLSTLDTSITWSKSVLNARCKICKRQSYADQMLLCDGCDRGHHMFCLKPPVKKVPQGEWFCPECRPKIVRKASPRKRRKSFAANVDDSSEDEEEEDSDDDDEDEDSSDQEEEEDSDDEDEEDEEEDSDDETETEESPKPAKISMRGMHKKPQPKSGRSTPNSVRSTSRAKNSPIEGRGSRASSRAGKRLSVEPTNSRPSSRAGKRNYSSDEDGDGKQTTKSRGSDISHSMKQMEKLVYEIVNHDDSWPFLKPVTKRDAPDYFDIVKRPMDLSTIRANINAYRYNGPAGIAEDVRQMFKNCEIYNLPTAEEYKLGVKLSKLFTKRIKELKIDLGPVSKEAPPAKEKEQAPKRPRRK